MTGPIMTLRSSATGRSARRLANLLGMSGLKVAVLEREPSIYHMPRAISLDGEGMRLFQTIGLAETLLPKLGLSRNIRHVNTEGKLLVLIARGGIGPDGWNHAYRFYQPELEGVLRDGVDAIRQRRRAAALRRVRARRARRPVFRSDMRTSAMASSAALTARYVVGCDGARSTVRRFMGAALQDLRSHERWIVLDMILDHAARRCAGSGGRNRPDRRCDPVLRPGAADDVHSDAGQTPSLGIHADARRRSGQDRAAGPDLQVAEALEDRSGGIADRACGRLYVPLLAGDDNGGAAGCCWPAIPRTRCRPSSDRAWAPACAMSSISPGSCAMSSMAARRKRCLTATRPSAWSMCAPISKLAVELGGVIQTTDPEKARQRDAELLANPTMMQADDAAARSGSARRRAAACRDARRAAALGDGTRLDDRVGYRFAVLARAGSRN